MITDKTQDIFINFIKYKLLYWAFITYNVFNFTKTSFSLPEPRVSQNLLDGCYPKITYGDTFKKSANQISAKQMHSDCDYLHAVKISHSLSTAPEKENFELKHVLHFWTYPCTGSHRIISLRIFFSVDSVNNEQHLFIHL